MPVTVPPIPVPVPTTSDRANFALRADATLGALPAVVDGMNQQNIENNLLHGQIHTKVDQALAAGLANAAANAATATAGATTATTKAGEASASAAAAAASAASAEAVVGLPAPTGADIGKFLGVGAGPAMLWLPAGARLVTEYLTSGTSWNAPANLVGGRCKARFVGAGGGGINGSDNASLAGCPGAYAEITAAVTPGSPYAYAIGAGGGGGASPGAGGATSVFGANAPGGPAGQLARVSTTADPTGADFGVANGVATVSGPASVLGHTPFGRNGSNGTSSLVSASGYGVGGRSGASPEAGRPGLIVLEYLVSA